MPILTLKTVVLSADSWKIQMRQFLVVILFLIVMAPSAFASIPSTSTAATCLPFQTSSIFTGEIATAASVLGFSIGSQEMTTEQINTYLDAIAASSLNAKPEHDIRVITGTAATSVQGRLLRYAIIGRKANVTKLDQIRKDTQKLIDPGTPAEIVTKLVADTPAILWVTGNVHGNEESGADAAVRVAYELADRNDCVVKRILDNAIVVVLPTQNPDGRELDTRRNAYGFDMNRDWFARTQTETDGKLELLRQLPPVLYIDAHETSTNHYFFPPYADPIYHEVPDRAFNWINNIYGASMAAEMSRQKIPFFNGAPYDLYAAEYGDTVPTIGFHAAGMTFEKYNGDSISARTYQHFVTMWTSLFAAASNKQLILSEWHDSYADAKEQGSIGKLEPNGIYFDGKQLFQEIPDVDIDPNVAIKHYFLLNDSNRSREVANLVRRLQRMDVKVWQLNKELEVSDFHAYGSKQTSFKILPADTYWIPMEQAQKHWIQAMLHADPYIPVSVSYDVSAWSNPLLMNISGGSSGLGLDSTSLDATLVAQIEAPPAPPTRALRIGLFEIPGSTTGFESAGSVRYLFEKVWNIPYVAITADQIKAGLQNIDVLLVPDGYANYGLQALGSKGKLALAKWVEDGGRYVGYLGGTELAVKSKISTVVLQASHTSAPGTLIRVKLDSKSPLADGIAFSGEPSNPTTWIMYFNDNRMTPGLGTAIATFPDFNDKDNVYTSGLAIGVDELSGTAAIVDEPVGNGRAILFSFDPNFRAWTDGTQRLLLNALFGGNPSPLSLTAQTELVKKRPAAIAQAEQAAQALPGLGKAIRIVVHPEDADATRILLQRYGAEFKELSKKERVIFLIENRQALSWDEHPFITDLARELKEQITPISFSVP